MLQLNLLICMHEIRLRVELFNIALCRYRHVLGTNIIVDDVLIPENVDKKKGPVMSFLEKFPSFKS